MSCLAYMAPFSAALMLLMCLILEPASLGLIVKLPFEDSALVSALLLNCLAAFASNYFNMVVTKRTSALTIQVCPLVPATTVSVQLWDNVGDTLDGAFYHGQFYACM